MKKTFFALLAILTLCNVMFAQKEIKAISKIKKVTVYRNGAQIYRTSEVDLPAGNSKIIIKGLSSKLDPNSLKVSGKGAFVILEQQTEILYPEPIEEKEVEIPAHITAKIKVLNDSLEIIQFEIEENNAHRDLIGVEANLLKNSKAITGTDTISELKEVLNYYRIRMTDINNEWFKVKKIEKQLNKKLLLIQQKLAELNDYKQKIQPKVSNEKPESFVTITVFSEKPVLNASIYFSYIAQSASWAPHYELKIDEVSKPVQLSMKAIVTQNTDENWDKVNITLSTGTPTANKALPNILPWYISYYMPQTIYTTNMSAPVSVSREESYKKDNKTKAVGNADTDDEYSIPGQSSDYVQQSSNILNTEYEISLPYEIPSDGKPHNITVLKENLSGTYKYMAIPKLDKDAFLTAALTGWEKLNLIPGKASVLFENSIIGQTFINPGIAEDTLIISLGTDKRVFVERKKLSDKSKDKIIGSTRERFITIEITVKNQNQSTINLTLKDQFPVSSINDIKVETEEVKDATVNIETGIIEWNLTLKPNETKKVSFKYLIKSDKNKPLLSE